MGVANLEEARIVTEADFTGSTREIGDLVAIGADGARGEESAGDHEEGPHLRPLSTSTAHKEC